jgi:hypothetical protein
MDDGSVPARSVDHQSNMKARDSLGSLTYSESLIVMKRPDLSWPVFVLFRAFASAPHEQT